MSREAQVVSFGEAIADSSHDSCLSALSAAVAELVGTHGRHPTSASSWWLDDTCVVTALEDFLTPAERALVVQGEERAVRDLRTAFGEAIRDEYVRAAEGALGREVIDHRSEVICAPAVCLEIFLLVDEQRIPSLRLVPAPEPKRDMPTASGAGPFALESRGAETEPHWRDQRVGLARKTRSL